MNKHWGWFAAVALCLVAAPAANAQAVDSTKPSLSAGRQLQAKVWVNTANGVYHCPGGKYYGKTKAGEYMTEAAARGSGYHAAQGNGCGTSSGGVVPPPGSTTSVWEPGVRRLFLPRGQVLRQDQAGEVSPRDRSRKGRVPARRWGGLRVKASGARIRS